jgi:CubicO group peptidase (beta-lactamase class C family)
MQKRMLFRAMACAVALWLPHEAPAAIIAPDTAASATEKTVESINHIFADYDRGDTPGYAIGVIKDGRLILAKGYGQANLDNGIPITSQTVFHLASLSKQFTAAALALAILDGKVSLDDPVAKYIPEAAKYGSRLRVKHLVYMTSGLTEYTDVKRPSGEPWFSDFYFTRDDAIRASMSVQSLLWEPGSRWSYSNINYMLITRIVEQAEGEPFGSFLRRRIFGPLGMNSTHLDDDTTEIVSHRAVGYGPRNDEIVAQGQKVGVTIHPGPGWAQLLRVSPHFGGSGVMSSLEDLAKWDANWDNPKVGGPAFVALMLKRMKFQHNKDNDAFGLVYGSYKARPMIWYSGEDLDASTYMARFPDQRLTLFCLSNMPTGDCEGRSAQVLDALIAGGQL